MQRPIRVLVFTMYKCYASAHIWFLHFLDDIVSFWKLFIVYKNVPFQGEKIGNYNDNRYSESLHAASQFVGMRGIGVNILTNWERYISRESGMISLRIQTPEAKFCPNTNPISEIKFAKLIYWVQISRLYLYIYKLLFFFYILFVSVIMETP